MPNVDPATPTAPRRIAVLGSTGSIGTQTLDVAAKLGPDRAVVVALAARGNVDLLASQQAATGASFVAVTDEARGPELEARFAQTNAKAGWGAGTLVHLATLPDVDTVVVAVAGAAGLSATLAACRAGKRVCIATKEVLVAAGELVMRTARENGAEILPIDSEHSAIFQCVQGYGRADIARLHITASGGPFRTWSRERIEAATVADALNHPTWRMGGKITIDSATLMNKGLEIIEAVHLFGVALDNVHVVVHPQSVVHSFAEMADGALLAQLGLPDMRLPIQIALLHPEKADTGLPRLKPAEMANLTFEEPDHARFPSINLARRAFALGGTTPAALNAANEVAAAAFLAGRIGLGAICRTVERVVSDHTPSPASDLATILNADADARRQAEAFIALGAV